MIARPGVGPATATFDVESVRQEFPILARTVHGKSLVYLDNAATSQKPRAVIDALVDYYSRHHSNIHRGIHALSEEATAAYEGARAKVRDFLKAPSEREVIFVRGATEAINLVAQAWARPNVGPGDEILISEMEHHSNIVPWQIVCEQTGAQLLVAPMDDAGDLIMEEYERRLSPRTRLVALTHVSNAIGTLNPVEELTRLAHEQGAVVLIDGAQGVPHLPVDVRELGCDFYAFSGHKMYGPTGIGVLWGRLDLLESMPPYQSGGSMISTVTFEKTTYSRVPTLFEAGTPDIAGAIGLGVAIDWLTDLGLEALRAHEEELLELAVEAVSELPDVSIVARPHEQVGVVSFNVGEIHAHDVGTILDQEGIAVRAGHHCAQPVMQHYGVPATTRVSFGAYNTRDDLDRLVDGLKRVLEIFA
ncbi:MAG: cysteine desulfurase [Myxococcota bacterium]